MLRIWLLSGFLCLYQSSQVSCQSVMEIQTIFELLAQGEDKVELNNQRQVVLVFGSTGSGKSTFIQWLAGDNTKLIAKETFADSGEYLIEDTSDRIGSSSVSKTLFPELIVDVVTGTTLYDFPGFSDTRSSSHDIAASYFMKSVMDHIESVKMVFVVSYYSVQLGMDRNKFPGLLKNIDDMIGDIEKFKNSIALAVSKVENNKPKRTVIKGIAHYLLTTRKDFEDVLEKSDISDQKRRFSANAMKIINILLTQENGEYTRIYLFRRPDKKGPLSEIKLLTSGRAIVQQAIAEKLRFTHTKVNDFGFTISDNSKLEIIGLVTEINDHITISIGETVALIRKYLESFVEPVRTKINANNLQNVSSTEALEFSVQTNHGQKVLSEAVDYFTSLSGIDGVAVTIRKYLSELGIAMPEPVVEKMSKFSKYFNFLQLFHEEPLPVSSLSWSKSFQSSLTYLTNSKQVIRDKASSLAEEINSQITFNVDIIVGKVKSILMDDVNQMTDTINSLANESSEIEVNPFEAKTFHIKLLTGERLLTELVESTKVLQNPHMLSGKISETLSSMNFEKPSDVLSNISRKSQEFEILQIVSDIHFSFPSVQWSNSIQTVVTFIRSQNILALVQHTKETIASKHELLLKALVENVRNIVDQKAAKLQVDVVEDELKRWHSLFATIRGGFGTEITLKQLIDDITSSLLSLGVSEKRIHTILRSLDEHEKYLGFLKAVKGESIEVKPIPAWKANIDNIVEYLSLEINFNAFVMSLFETLSQYTVQSDVTRYDVLHLLDWGKTGHAQGINIDKNNFKMFMERVKVFNIETADKIRNIFPSESQISILNNVLKVTLKKRVVTKCPSASDSTIVLKANFIKFSDFLDSNGKFKGCGWSDVSSLEIYALSTLFIDLDLVALGDRLKLSIVATKWEVISKRRIFLDGRDAQVLPKGADGIFPGGHGENGSPGSAGESGGSFFGVASRFTNSESLTISANGGMGASGQSGGDGAIGQNGTSPEFIFEDCDDAITSYIRDGFQVVDKGDTFSCGDFFKKCRSHTIFGSDGENGGNAGSCGVGGHGGFSGQILVISLTESSRELKVTTAGKRGENGVSGTAGLGGHHGENRGMLCEKELFQTYRVQYIAHQPRGTALNGTSSSGCNANIPANPLPARNIQHPASSLRNFIKFLIENSNERFVRLSTHRIYEQINTNPETRDLQDTFGLIEDLKMLASISRESNLNLVPFYESHLANIEKYATSPKAIEKSDEFKKVLSYLYTASLTQISNLKKNPDSDLIIDVNGYLSIVSQNIEALNSLQDESRLVTVVESLKNSFKNEIDKKIEETQNLIQGTVTPEFVKIGSQFEVQISGLVQETVALQDAATEEKAALEAKKKELEKAMMINTFLKVVKVVGHATAFCGGTGQEISSVIEIGTSIASALNQGDQLTFPQTSESVKEKLQGFGNSALDLSESIKRDENEILQVTKGLRDVEVTLQKLKSFEKKVYDKLVPMIEKMGKDLLKTANALNSKSIISLDVISWQVQGTLRDTSLEIQQFTLGFKVHGSIARSVEKLEEAMTTLIKVYDRIQDYQEQQRLAVYLAQLSSASVKQIVVSNSMVSNSFRDLQICIRSNIILNQYKAALSAFKQWIFPFAEVFLKEFQLPAELVSSNTDIESLASTAAFRIEDIRSRIQKYKTTIGDFDKHIYLAQFNGSSAVMKPFYVWKNEEHRDIITRLLAGKTVLIKADITKSAADKDAIKFNFIEFGLKSDDPAIQADVDRILLNYVVSMTHLGNSYYRYSGQYFSIASSSQTMQYSVEKGTIQNNVYKKLLSGDIILSPYAMWELRLSLNPSKPVNSLVSLEKYSAKVDLVLEGSGSFVNTGDTKFDVESYYMVENSIKLTKG